MFMITMLTGTWQMQFGRATVDSAAAQKGKNGMNTSSKRSLGMFQIFFFWLSVMIYITTVCVCCYYIMYRYISDCCINYMIVILK